MWSRRALRRDEVPDREVLVTSVGTRLPIVPRPYMLFDFVNAVHVFPRKHATSLFDFEKNAV